MTEQGNALLHETIQWWERHRIKFNILVGIAGGATVFYMATWEEFGLFDIFGILMWGIVANIFYSVGILTEVVNQHYLSGKFSLYPFRKFLWVVGTSLYCAVSILYGVLYYELELFYRLL